MKCIRFEVWEGYLAYDSKNNMRQRTHSVAKSDIIICNLKLQIIYFVSCRVPNIVAKDTKTPLALCSNILLRNNFHEACITHIYTYL